MDMTIPKMASPGYGDITGLADIATGMDILDAAALIASHTSGGAPALAVRMGVSANTLQHKLNPNNVTHHLSLREALQIQQLTGLPYVLQAMAASMGYACQPAGPANPDVTVSDAFMAAQCDFSELIAAAADAMRGPQVSPNAMRRIRERAQEAIASIGQLTNAAAARVPVRDAA